MFTRVNSRTGDVRRQRLAILGEARQARVAIALEIEGRAVMAETPTDVLVAGYQDIDEATKDFEARKKS